MDLDFVSLVPAGDDPMASVMIAKAAPDDNDQLEDRMNPISKDGLDPEVATYITALEAENDVLAEQVAKSEEDEKAHAEALAAKDEQIAKMVPATDEAADEISKSVLAKADPAVRALIEKQQADLAEVRKQADEERDARISKEFVSKAETFPMLGDDKVALGGLLRRISEALSPEENAEIDKVLKSANEAIAQGNLFESFGSGGAITTVSQSTEAAAAEIIKAEPTLTKEQAIAKAYATNPALLTEAMTNGNEG